MAVFTCPQCGHSQAVDDKHVGKNATCPKCKTQGVVQQASHLNATAQPQDDPHAVTTRTSRQPKKNRPFFNEDSAMLMEWVVIDDPRMPVAFREICGLLPSIDAQKMLDRGGGEHLCYLGNVSICTQGLSVVAYEVRFILFDIWGDSVRTLSALEVRDLGPGEAFKQDYRWDLFSMHEGWAHFASIGYVARVRNADGQVVNADTAAVLREAQRFSEKFTEKDLEPKSPKKE